MTSAVILAAGRARRMGAQKLLLPVGHSTVIARVADAFLHAPVDEVIVVTRTNDSSIRTALGDRPLTIVENADEAGDMLSSVRVGLKALRDSVRTILICPGDLPLLEPSLVQQLLAAFNTSDRRILVPTCHGRRGHPLLMAAEWRGEALSRFEGKGLRGLLEAHPNEVLEWPVEQDSILQDLDTPEDYQRVLSVLPPSDSP